MKRARKDEPQSSVVGGSGDAPAVVTAVAGESSSGAPAAPRRAITIAASTIPIVVAVDEMEMEDPVAPAADLQNQHAGQVIVMPDDDYYAGYNPDSIEYMVEEDHKEAEPFKEEASDDNTEVLSCSNRSPLFVVLFTLCNDKCVCNLYSSESCFILVLMIAHMISIS
jgi:hypothetical protein